MCTLVCCPGVNLVFRDVNIFQQSRNCSAFDHEHSKDRYMRTHSQKLIRDDCV